MRCAQQRTGRTLSAEEVGVAAARVPLAGASNRPGAVGVVPAASAGAPGDTAMAGPGAAAVVAIHEASVDFLRRLFSCVIRDAHTISGRQKRRSPQKV